MGKILRRGGGVVMRRTSDWRGVMSSEKKSHMQSFHNLLIIHMNEWWVVSGVWVWETTVQNLGRTDHHLLFRTHSVNINGTLDLDFDNENNKTKVSPCEAHLQTSLLFLDFT